MVGLRRRGSGISNDDGVRPFAIMRLIIWAAIFLITSVAVFGFVIFANVHW